MTKQHTRKPFLPVLKDAVGYTQLASSLAPGSSCTLSAKAAILHCAFTVEALANNLIQFISVGSRLGDSIEKLDPIGKIELFALLMRKSTEFDRGAKCIQTFASLIKVRNWYVHPKILTQKLDDGAIGLDDLQYPTLQQLGIKFSPEKWNQSDSVCALKALVIAIDELLLDVLKLEMKSMSCMFYDHLVWNSNAGQLVTDDSDWAVWLESELGCRPSFFMDHILERFK